jgi:hypothetical protein
LGVQFLERGRVFRQSLSILQCEFGHLANIRKRPIKSGDAKGDHEPRSERGVERDWYSMKPDRVAAQDDAFAARRSRIAANVVRK